MTPSNIVPLRATFQILTENHYLGPTKTADFAWQDVHGTMVFAAPRARNIPGDWLELVRWCLTGGPNSGSQQWAAFVGFARATLRASTVVSYSDPSQGHTGALYRACGWLWAPTWHRLRPPPSGNGAWTEGKQQAVKDRWIFPLAPDERRAAVLTVKDDSVMKQFGWAQYREPTWRRSVPHLDTGGGDYKRFIRSR
jgi:hypothetical protein